MSRPKKTGRRATGVIGKQGYLYIRIPKEGKPGATQELGTKLKDTPENVKKAVAMREHILAQRETGKLSMTSTVSDAIDVFLAAKKRSVSHTTYKGYFYRLERFRRRIGTIPLRILQTEDIEQAMDSMYEPYDEHERTKTTDTIMESKKKFSAALNVAVKEGIIASNPAEEATLNSNLVAEHAQDEDDFDDDKFFSKEQAIMFLEIAKKEVEYNMFALFYFSLYFCLRRSEVLGIRWKDIDFENKTLKIRHTVTKGDGVKRQNTTKTELSKSVFPLETEHTKMLKQIKEEQKNDKKGKGSAYSDNDYVFKDESGKAYYPDRPSKVFARLIDHHPELPQNITFHGLRRSGISIMIHDGYDPKTVQDWARHKDIDTTLKFYAMVKTRKSRQDVSQVLITWLKPF